ncbi:MAG: glycosyltransferase family 2 protein, partial [Candidatus Melainabacteria bacterium]|nr:glycosyltransferase family 2 protein [Candidatus Melainabacteria bacterium]
LDYEIVLVDNGSSDPLEEISGVTLLKNATNLGFAEGNNVGIRYALEQGADAVLLFNNDAVADPGLLSAFVSAARINPQAGVFGAKIYFHEDPTVIWHAGGNIDLHTLRCYHEGHGATEGWDTVRPIVYGCGCTLFVTKEAILRSGLMAPEFFLLWEEIDWCFRIRKAGLECLFVPTAKAWHKISRSFEGGARGPLWQYYHFRNRLLFLKRNIPLSKRLRFYLVRFPKELAEILYFSVHPKAQKEIYRAALKGIRDSLSINK